MRLETKEWNSMIVSGRVCEENGEVVWLKEVGEQMKGRWRDRNGEGSEWDVRQQECLQHEHTVKRSL
jgi:hypothetical protein